MPLPQRRIVEGSQRVQLEDFRENVTHYLNELGTGTVLTIEDHGKVLAEVRAPIPVDTGPRRPGLLKGRFTVPDDFDETPPEENRRCPGALKGKLFMADDFDETPAEIIDAMENGPL